MDADTSYAAETGATEYKLVTTKMLRDKISSAKDYNVLCKFIEYSPSD